MVYSFKGLAHCHHGEKHHKGRNGAGEEASILCLDPQAAQKRLCATLARPELLRPQSSTLITHTYAKKVILLNIQTHESGRWGCVCILIHATQECSHLLQCFKNPNIVTTKNITCFRPESWLK